MEKSTRNAYQLTPASTTCLAARANAFSTGKLSGQGVCAEKDLLQRVLNAFQGVVVPVLT
jgi:hypothetical protein